MVKWGLWSIHLGRSKVKVEQCRVPFGKGNVKLCKVAATCCKAMFRLVMVLFRDALHSSVLVMCSWDWCWFSAENCCFMAVSYRSVLSRHVMVQ
jgi:hypothetical protein